MNETKILYTDGACKFNNSTDISKRKMYICFVDSSKKDIPSDPMMRNFQIREPIAISRQYGGSNNLAELIALHECLTYCIKWRYKDILIKVDSKILSYWFKSGKVKKDINLPGITQEILNKTKELEKKFDSIKLEVISRNDNLAGWKLDAMKS